MKSIGNIVFIEGKFDMKEVEKFKKIFFEMVEAGYKDISLDVSKCEYIDSKGLGILIFIFNKLKTIDGTLEIWGAKGKVKEIFILTKLDKVFNLKSKQ